MRKLDDILQDSINYLARTDNTGGVIRMLDELNNELRRTKGGDRALVEEVRTALMNRSFELATGVLVSQITIPDIPTIERPICDSINRSDEDVGNANNGFGQECL